MTGPLRPKTETFGEVPEGDQAKRWFDVLLRESDQVRNATPQCPVCGLATSNEAELECPACGVVFAKVRPQRASTVPVTEPAARTSKKTTDFAAIFAIGALVTGMLAGLILLFGQSVAGWGHGIHPWFIGLGLSGLGLSALTWLGFLLSVVFELRRLASGLPVRWWFGGTLIFLAAFTILGSWWLQG